MNQRSHTFVARNLLENSHWLGRLAHRLVNDQQKADDIVQEAWLALLESPPKNTETPRAWLATVARRLAAKGFRTEARRLQREQRVARTELDEPTDIVERAEIHKQLVDTVLALDEPYRSTLLEHYFDQRSATEIGTARHQPAATIRSQIGRGLDMLRQRLDQEHHGNRRAWSLSLMPMAIRHQLQPSATAARQLDARPKRSRSLPSRSLTLRVASGALLLALVLICALYFPNPAPPHATSDDATAGVQSPSLAADPSGLSPDGALAPPVATVAADVPSEATLLHPDTTSTPETPATIVDSRNDVMLRGVVLDFAGKPIAGIAVFVDSRVSDKAHDPPLDDAVASTDSGGHFRIDPGTLARNSFLMAESSHLTTLRRGWFDASQTAREILIVVAEVGELQGVVRADNGDPLVANLNVHTHHAELVDFPETLENTGPISVATTCNEDGSFELPRFPKFPHAKLDVHCDGYKDRHLLVGSLSRHPEIVLRPIANASSSILRGVVRFSNGDAAAGAQVHFGNTTTTSDTDGHFEVFVNGIVGPEQPLVAALPSHAPAVVFDFGKAWQLRQTRASREPSASNANDDFVELFLGDQPLAIEGRILDADDQPQAGWRVHLADATEVSVGRYPALFAETLFTEAGTDGVETDATGAFRLDGLLRRSYTIFAYHRETLLSLRSNPIAAGATDAILRLPQDPFLPELRGRVVSRSGRPIAEVTVTPSLQISSGDMGSVSIHSNPATTDHSGYFTLINCVRNSPQLSVNGNAVIPETFNIAEADLNNLHPLQPLELTVAARCRFRIEAAHLDPIPDQGSILDGNGETLSTYRFVAGGFASNSRVVLTDGRTPVLSVSEDARTLLLIHDGTELGRYDLELDPGRVTTIQP